jgi:hypothetical protein
VNKLTSMLMKNLIKYSGRYQRSGLKLSATVTDYGKDRLTEMATPHCIHKITLCQFLQYAPANVLETECGMLGWLNCRRF